MSGHREQKWRRIQNQSGALADAITTRRVDLAIPDQRPIMVQQGRRRNRSTERSNAPGESVWRKAHASLILTLALMF